MYEIFHIVPLQATSSEVYNALVDEQALGRWWLEGARTSELVGSIASFPLSSGQGDIRMKILDLIPGERVYWECVEHMHNDWIGTNVEFRIIEKGTDCELHFRHSNWRTTDGVFGLVSYFWAALYLTRLRGMFGKGQ